jgi:hypothetical protein
VAPVLRCSIATTEAVLEHSHGGGDFPHLPRRGERTSKQIGRYSVEPRLRFWLGTCSLIWRCAKILV